MIRDLEFDLVTNVREKRPRIIPDDFIEDFLVWKSNDPSTRVLAGDILAAELPQCCVEITDVDHVASGVADFDSVTDSERLANENVNPGDETLCRCLDGETDDDRTDAERGERAVPIDEDN